MRKLVIACLAVAATLALAGTQQWIGPSPYLHYTIPNPEPGIFPYDPGVFMPAVDTIKYDDNMAASAWAMRVLGGGWGVKFISPSDNVTLTGALIHFYSGWPIPGDTWAMVKVYADDGAAGSPGTELFASDTVAIRRGQWNFIPINVPVVASNFYIFYTHADTYPNCPGLSIDAFNNAPSHRKWSTTGPGSFSEDATRGDWLIRAVLDWTPQGTNASAIWFATNMPKDTVPNINLQIRTMIKNLGNNALPVGTPVRLHITGPPSYVFEDTMTTTSALNRGQTQQMNFSPAWHIPTTVGAYNIKCWTEAAGEEWPANDTIAYDLSVARWIQYFNEAGLAWLTWAGPERSVKFNPQEFALTYPVGITRARADFYLHASYPWPDSTFHFKVYGDDGSTLLYESDDIEAIPGQPGAFTAANFDTMLILSSGEFYVSVAPVSPTGHPSTCASDSPVGKSFVGSAGSWAPWTMGEFFISASAQGGVGVEEGFEPGVRGPSLRITNYPNPARGPLTVKWQVPNREPVSVNLYDATGRLLRNLYATDNTRVGTLVLDTRSIAAGIYLLRLETKNGSATRKLVIQQ
jgi:hypothetical protein